MAIEGCGTLGIVNYGKYLTHMYDTIAEITEIGYDNVYDIINYEAVNGDGVYEDEGHFVVDGLIVHNCIPEYVERRDDKAQNWKVYEHPEIAAELEDTHGIIVYQEQLQSLWQKFAGFTAPEAEAARKAVAKKWTEKLKGIEAQWVKGASKTIGEEWATTMWERMVTFGRYAFNRCLSKNTVLIDPVTNNSRTVEELSESIDGFKLLSFDGNRFVPDSVEEVIDSGEQEVFEVTFDNGIVQAVTKHHRFLCDDGEYRTVEEIIEGDYSVIVRSDDTECPN